MWTSYTWAQVGVFGLAGCACAQANLYLTSAVLHRGLCHRSIRYPGWLLRGVGCWLWLTACIPPLSWVACHLQHHARSDTAEDPHAPGVKGFWSVLLFTWCHVPRWVRANRPAIERLLHGSLRGDRFLRLLDLPLLREANFYLQLLGSILLGPAYVTFWFGRIVPYMILSGYVNAIGHTCGERPHPNAATNAATLPQRILGYVVAGETLGHNNHHHRPGLASFSSQSFDPGYWFATRVLQGTPVHNSVVPFQTEDTSTQQQ